MTIQLIQGDCLQEMKDIPDGSVDAVITDPPYAEIYKPYGQLSEQEWKDMMSVLCCEIRRVLKPSGSAMFVLQPNMSVVGSVRPWLWDFMSWVCREWNMIQDVWWWNNTTMPSCQSNYYGMLRGSIKACVWAGAPDCYKNQAEILWEASDDVKAKSVSKRLSNKRRYSPGGGDSNAQKMNTTFLKRGGVTPFNLLPIPNSDSQTSSGALGHPAGTPLPLMDWWVRYISPPGGLIVDPFDGAGTTMLACVNNGRNGIGIEIDPGYFEIAKRRIEEAQLQVRMPL